MLMWKKGYAYILPKVKSLKSGMKRLGLGNNATVLFLRCLVIIPIETNPVMKSGVTFFYTYLY